MRLILKENVGPKKPFANTTTSKIISLKSEGNSINFNPLHIYITANLSRRHKKVKKKSSRTNYCKSWFVVSNIDSKNNAHRMYIIGKNWNCTIGMPKI